MSRRVLALSFLVLAATAVAEDATTWQDANHQSADLLKGNGDPGKAADLAYKAFELYGVQSQHYSATNHAQLLMNAVDARLQTQKLDVAIRDLKRGIEAVEKHAGDDPVLINLYDKAIEICTVTSDTETYYEKAAGLAAKAWGYGDERTVAINLSWVRSFYFKHEERWMASKLADLRERAALVGAPPVVLLNVDLGLAQGEATRKNYRKAAELYRPLLDRAAALPDAAERKLLYAIYSDLRDAYEHLGDQTSIVELDGRALTEFGLDRARPVKQVLPIYPSGALRNHLGGSVLVELNIGPDGSVQHVSVLRSIPAGMFDAAAITALRQWKFAPKIVDGKPVAQTAVQPLEFKLGD